MTFTITDQEMLAAHGHPLGLEQTVLQILKEKGAPVEGSMFLAVDRRKWNYTVDYDMFRCVTTFVFIRREE